MSRKKASNESNAPSNKSEITGVEVAGYKAISEKQGIEVRPLTLLAGANSSGKSSMIQPLLLLKQTLEASYDPGALLLSGPNVQFTQAEQLFSSIGDDSQVCEFRVGVRFAYGGTVTTVFGRKGKEPIDVLETSRTVQGEKMTLRPDMSDKDMAKLIPPRIRASLEKLEERGGERPQWDVARVRCFLEMRASIEDRPVVGFSPAFALERQARRVIHLPGLRGNPERNYPVTAVGQTFPGTFEKYTASIIAQWESSKDEERLDRLNKDLKRLGLTWKVRAKPVSDTQVELHVGRLPTPRRGGAFDLVSIADVGFGVSQVLPLLVALHVADPGQVVYVEQPELHLHPRAQVALARILADTAERGVRVVAETHSSLLLLGVQSLVAEEKLASKAVKLHWFERGLRGATKVSSADLDEDGAFGDWPEDFGVVNLDVERRYLNAIESRHAQE